jgi:hypothetical protein
VSLTKRNLAAYCACAVCALGLSYLWVSQVVRVEAQYNKFDPDLRTINPSKVDFPYVRAACHTQHVLGAQWHRKSRSPPPPPPPHHAGHGPRASSIGILPADVLYDVLLHLPAKTLCRLRAVSRWWRSLLTADPHFAKARPTRPTTPTSTQSSSTRTTEATPIPWTFPGTVSDG